MIAGSAQLECDYSADAIDKLMNLLSWRVGNGQNI